MLKRLFIYPTSACLRNCTFCFIKEMQTPDRPVEFFEQLLDQTRDVPDWIFSVDVLASDKLFDVRRLIQHAWHYNHSYALMTNYEQLQLLDVEMLKRARGISISLDEYKVGDQEWSAFLQSLTWAYTEKLMLEVNIALTPFMIRKLQEGLLFDRLLDFAGMVNLYAPKNKNYPMLTRDDFDVFLDFLVMRMRVNAQYLAKVNPEGCLMPQLNPRNNSTNTDCPRLGSLSVLPDGSLRICPFGRKLGTLAEPADIRPYLTRRWTEMEKKEYNHCVWRAGWDSQTAASGVEPGGQR